MEQSLPILTEEEINRSTPTDEEHGFGSLSADRGHLPLKAMDVQVQIDGLLANVEIEQTFVNTFDEPLEATYIFPLPDQAAVTKFRMTVADRIVEGELQERGTARRTYDQAMSTGNRAAIAEEERPGVFTIRVGNIPPGESAAVRLELSQPLVYDEGEVTYRFPLVVAPRYMPGVPLGGANVGDGVAADTDAVPDASRISPPVLLPGYPNPVRLSLAVDVAPALSPSDFRSSLHSVFLQRDVEGRHRFRFQPCERLNRDFVLRFRIGAETIQSSLQLVPDGDNHKQGTFALTLLPPKSAHRSSRPRDIVFVVDRSGSMCGWKMVSARRAVAQMIETLTVQDRFNVYVFDNQLETPPMFHGPALCDATNRNRCRAVDFLMQVEARGGTEMAQPLDLAVKHLNSDRDRVLVLITDGQVGNEDQILRTIGGRLDGIRIFTLGIDSAVNVGFLKRLAALGGGSCDVVESEHRLAEVIYKIHRRISAPAISDIRVDLDGVDADSESFVPGQRIDLFDGSPVTVMGRYHGAPEAVAKVHATDKSGRAWSQSVTGAINHNPAAGVIWARHRIRGLEDQFVIGSGASSGELEQQIIATSLRFRVLCRFTAFVAVDKTESVNEGGWQHKVVQAVEAPAGWGMIEAVASGPVDKSRSADVTECGTIRTPAQKQALQEMADFECAPMRVSAQPSETPQSNNAPPPAPCAIPQDADAIAPNREEDVELASTRSARPKRMRKGKNRIQRSESEYASGKGLFSRIVDSVKKLRGRPSESDRRRQEDASDQSTVLPDIPEFSAYQKRLERILDELRQSANADPESRRHALAVCLVQLRELLEDMRSTGVSEQLFNPIQELADALDTMSGESQPTETEVDQLWNRTEQTLSDFPRQTQQVV